MMFFVILCRRQKIYISNWYELVISDLHYEVGVGLSRRLNREIFHAVRGQDHRRDSLAAELRSAQAEHEARIRERMGKTWNGKHTRKCRPLGLLLQVGNMYSIHFNSFLMGKCKAKIKQQRHTKTGFCSLRSKQFLWIWSPFMEMFGSMLCVISSCLQELRAYTWMQQQGPFSKS